MSEFLRDYLTVVWFGLAALAVGAVPYPAGIPGLMVILAFYALGQGLIGVARRTRSRSSPSATTGRPIWKG